MSRNPSVSLSIHQQEFVESLVKSGRYQGVSEVVRAGLRLLEERESRHKALIARLEAAVEEGLASGESEPLESAEELIAEFQLNGSNGIKERS
jgi:antitoxin ParD1/3/4